MVDRIVCVIDVGEGRHEAPPLQVVITSPKSVGVPLMGTLAIHNIAPMVKPIPIPA